MKWRDSELLLSPWIKCPDIFNSLPYLYFMNLSRTTILITRPLLTVFGPEGSFGPRMWCPI